MLNFLYFLPQILRQDVTKEKLIAVGLGTTLRDRMSKDDLANKGRLAMGDVLHGPAGHAGTIVYPLPTTPTDDEADGVGYYPDRQQWLHVEVDGTAGYWIGWNPEQLATPEDLQRDSVVSGYLEELGDGQLWECPIIRLQQGKVNLPDTWGLKQGKVVSRVRPDWKWAWELSGTIWDQLIAGIDPTEETAFSWCAQLLSINYRVGPEELSIMGVLGVASASVILRTAINGPFIEQLRAEQKKRNTPETDSVSSSSPGSKDGTQPTAPAGQTSI